MKHMIGKLAATTAALFVLILPAHSSVVPGELLGVFSGNDSVAGLLDNLGIEATFLAKINMPSAIETSELSSDGLTISDFLLNSSDEALSGQWSYSGPEIASIIVLKASGQYAVYAFDDELTNNMPNIGLFDTSDLDDKGLSHISAYSTAVVPVPGALLMFVSGLLGLGIVRRRKPE
ncbi:MAG: VPLPA-CTERM sorting domain-containing protein [Gammaproteobacteria bacterium]|nr:VPLPA-CTERM sorting domain-containing protein [Gammaproteobacteria bacterium]MDH3767407.1 VPLPA-CTERM sorting domain-containing protein [Gammaproteobacteria bacterium]